MARYDKSCSSFEITKTYVKGWKTYIPLDSSEISELIDPYFNEDSNCTVKKLLVDNFLMIIDIKVNENFLFCFVKA